MNDRERNSEDYTAPATRAAEAVRVTRELIASGYSEDVIAQAMTADEQTVARLIRAAGEDS